MITKQWQLLGESTPWTMRENYEPLMIAQYSTNPFSFQVMQSVETTANYVGHTISIHLPVHVALLRHPDPMEVQHQLYHHLLQHQG